MGKRMNLSRHFIVSLILIGFLYCLSAPGLGKKSSALSIEKNKFDSSRLESRFFQVIRKNETTWMIRVRSMWIWFTPDEIILHHSLSTEKSYQMRLILNSPDNSQLVLHSDQNKLWYSHIMEGIHLCFYINHQGNLEYDIILDKPASLERLRFTVSEGQVSLTKQGLKWTTPFFTMHKNIVAVYEQDSLQSVGWVVKTDSQQSYHFELLYPDSLNYPVVLDPEIVFSTYFHESDEIRLNSVTTDAAGAIYACGNISLPRVFSTDGLHVRKQDDLDVFLLKTDRLGKEIIQFFVFGGVNGDELAPVVALSVNGAVYIAGTTTSDDFPVSSNAIQSSYQGFGDAFCFIINPETREVLFSSYWGGSQADHLTSLAIQPSGNAVLAGNTISKDFPVYKATQIIKNAFYDGFLSVIAIDKTQAEFSTFLGGNQQDSIDCVAIQKDGSLVLSGRTMSSDFYIQANQPNRYQGDGDIFITIYSSTYTYTFSNLFGGSSDDYPGDITCNQNNIYLVGTTLSDDFPCSSYQLYNGHGTQDEMNGGDILLMKLQGTNVVYAGYLGGSEDEMGVSITLDDEQYIYITANTRSDNIPVTHNAFKRILTDYLTYSSGCEGFIAKLDKDFSRVLFGSYWGGFGDDRIEHSILYHNQLSLVGYTDSEDFPTTPWSFKVEKNNDQECFLSSIILDYYPPSIPENVSIIMTEEGNSLVWSPSEPGEAPIKGYGVISYVFDPQQNPQGKKDYTEILQEDLLQFKLPVFQDKVEYYFAVCAIDMNGKTSDYSKEVSRAEKSTQQEAFLLAEWYDADRTTGMNEAIIQYLSNLDSPILEVLHYYPNKYNSNLMKIRKKDYGFCVRNWCVVNGLVSLTLLDILEDKQRISEIAKKTHPFRITWEKLSVPNEKQQEIKLVLSKSAPYPETILYLSVLSAKSIVPFHWEILPSEIKLWKVPIQLFGHEEKGFSFYRPIDQNIEENLTENALIVLLQDPKNFEILAYTILP